MEALGSNPIVAKMDGESDNDIEESLDAQHVNINNKNGCMLDSACFSSSSVSGKSEKENIDHDGSTRTGDVKADGPEEFSMPLVEVSEWEKETEDRRVSQVGFTDNGESHTEVDQQSNVTAGEQEPPEDNCGGKNPHSAKRDKLLTKHQCVSSKLLKTGTSVPGMVGNSPSQIQKSRHSQISTVSSKGPLKSGARGIVDSSCKQKKATAEKSEIQDVGVQINGSSTLVPRTANIGVARSNRTIPQPFALSSGKKASSGSGHADNNACSSIVRKTSTSSTSSSVTKDIQLSTKSALRTSTTKLSRSGNSKLNRHVLKDIQQKQSNADVEDACSVASSVTSVKVYKSTPAGYASLYRFGTRCNERAEKRKEYFSKLDEKLHAKEAERNQLQAKTKEEKEAAIKELRKSLTFKATPMPSFYHEPAPPKVEIKKLPTTRAISPQFGRRKSGSGAESEGTPTESCRTPHFTLDQSKIDKSAQKHSIPANSNKMSDKDKMAGDNFTHKSLTKLPFEKTPKRKSKERLVTAESTKSANGSIESGKATVIRDSHNCSASSNHDQRSELQCETILGKKEAAPSIIQNEIVGGNIEDNILTESDNLIDTLEDLGSDLLESDEDLQACFVPNLI